MTNGPDLAERVGELTTVDPDEFAERARADADTVKTEFRNGTFDNHQSIVGFEYEFYAVADGRWSGESTDRDYALMRVPRRLLELIGFEKELGLHNAEMTTSPQPLSEAGLAAQEAEVRANLGAALECTAAEGMRLVSDGLWTIPPTGETAREYLTDSVEDGGVRIATNMSDAVRYHAMANTTDAPVRLSAPGVHLDAETVMPESLITSIQPHYQVAYAADFPTHFRYALRIAGPLLALGVNSPFFPPDLYDDDWTGEDVLERGHQENRIHVFESVLNAKTETDKVRFPDDVGSVETAVDRIAADEAFVPMPATEGNRFDDRFATLRTKHGTYWRWVRPVFGGATRSSANARIEFRPIAAQPTVRDSIAFLAAFAGLMEALPRREHPVYDLDWEQAAANFYAAVEDGIDADLAWIAHDGTLTRDRDVVFADLLDHAAAGLEAAGCDEGDAERWLAPLRWRADEGVTPASWKRDRVRDRLAAGESFAGAVQGMQREYVGKQSETLIEGSLVDW